MASLTSSGCVRYYAGLGYTSTWQASRTTTQSYAAPVQAASPPVLILDTQGSGEGWVTGSTATTAATAATTSIEAGSVSGSSGAITSTTSAATSTASATSRVSLSGSGASGCTSSCGGALVAEAPRGEVVASLGGLCGAGAPVEGGVARLSDLDALAGLGGLAGASTLYADANVRVQASLAHDALPASGGASGVVVSVEGLAPPRVIAPLRVHLVIDASTSMEGAWLDVKTAALAVLGRLRPQDELQIVVYGSDAREVLPPIAVGDGQAAREVIRGLRYGGRTNIEAGLRLAYGACRPAGRSLVVVISDGVPQGGLSSPHELGALAAEANASAGAVTLAIGLGTEFHTGILAALGERGGGGLEILPRSSELAALLERELAARGAIVASDLDARIDASPGVVLGGPARSHAGALTAGEAVRFVVPLETDHSGPIAHVRLSLTLASGQPLELEASLSTGSASAPVPAGAMAASLDLSLAEALRAAGQLVENGDGAGAAMRLRTYVTEAQASVPSPSAAVTARNEAVLRIATGLPGFVAEASWGARRQAGASFAARSFVIEGR
ncbi:MAG: VWA domain-containing protein [Sandaracinus sp.]